MGKTAYLIASLLIAFSVTAIAPLALPMLPSTQTAYALKTETGGEITTKDTALKDYTYQIYTWSLRLGVLAAVAIVVFGGFLYITSGGNPDTIKSAKQWIFGAFISLALLAMAKAIFATIGLKWIH